MIKCKCIEKIRDKHNKIIAYKLVDKNGNIIEINANDLKCKINFGHIYVENLTLTTDGRLVDKVSESSLSDEQLNNCIDNIKDMGIGWYASILSDLGVDVLGAMYLYLPENATKDMNVPLQIETYRNGIQEYGTVDDLISNPQKFIGCFINDVDSNIDTKARLETEAYDEILRGCSIKATSYNASRFNAWDKGCKFRILCLILHKDGEFKTVAFGVYEGTVKVHNSKTLLRDDKTSTTFVAVNNQSDIIYKAVGINFNRRERLSVANMIVNSDLKYWGSKVTISKLLVKLGKVKNRMELDDKLHGLASAGRTAGVIVTYPLRVLFGF